MVSYVNSVAAEDVARRLAYVEGGLAMLALEKGAQLMQVGITRVLLQQFHFCSLALQGFGGISVLYL